ncbi:DNA-directed RNA polymerases IV and V subunit 2-like protein [Tanacetum coccineum]
MCLFTEGVLRFKGIAKVALTHVKWGMVERVIVLSGVAGVEGKGLNKVGDIRIGGQSISFATMEDVAAFLEKLLEVINTPLEVVQRVVSSCRSPLMQGTQVHTFPSLRATSVVHLCCNEKLPRAFSTGSWSHCYKSWEKTFGVVAFIRRAALLQMVSHMRRTCQQVLYAGKARDARYPSSKGVVQTPPNLEGHKRAFITLCSKSTTSEWSLASDWSPDDTVTSFAYWSDLLLEMGARVELDTVVAPPLFLHHCDANVAKNVAAITSTSIQNPVSKAFERGANIGDVTAEGLCVFDLKCVFNKYGTNKRVTEKPTNRSVHIDLDLENDDNDMMIDAPSVRDLDQPPEVSHRK